MTPKKTRTTRTKVQIPPRQEPIFSVAELSNPDTTKKEMGRRIAAFMERAEMTQSDLARATDIGKDSISQYVNGKQIPGAVNRNKIAMALDVEVMELFPPKFQRAMAHNAEGTLRFALSPTKPGFAWIEVAQLLPAKDARDVLAIVTEAIARESAKK